jgi:geranylgeranyl diphosphate synthase type II
MLIRLLQVATEEERVQIAAVLQSTREERTADRVCWVRELMDKYDCLTYAQQIAHGLAGAALHEYSLLYAHLSDSRDKRFVEGLVTWAFERTS